MWVSPRTGASERIVLTHCVGTVTFTWVGILWMGPVFLGGRGRGRGTTGHDCRLRWENRPANRLASRETGLEMPCCPANDLLWVQITQSYPNRLRFSSLPCPQSPCHDKTSSPTKPLAGLAGHQRWGMEECVARLVQTFPDLQKNWSIPVF